MKFLEIFLDLLTSFFYDFQLNKRFVLSFLNVHGKLFTKVGYVCFYSDFYAHAIFIFNRVEGGGGGGL